MCCVDTKKRNCLLNLYKRRVVSPISWGIVKYLYLSAPIISPLTFLALLYKKLEIMCISHKVSIGLKTGQKKEKLAIFKSLLLKKHNDMTIYRKWLLALPLVIAWSFENYLTFLNVSFLVCKMEKQWHVHLKVAVRVKWNNVHQAHSILFHLLFKLLCEVKLLLFLIL